MGGTSAKHRMQTLKKIKKDKKDNEHYVSKRNKNQVISAVFTYLVL